MKTKAVFSDFIRVPTLRLLIVTLCLMILPHVAQLPTWVSIFCFVVLIGRLLASRLGWRPLPKILLTLITLATVVGLVITFRNLFGREVGIALLVIMLALKTLELRALRDVMVVVCLGYFLVVTGFLSSQSIFMAAYLMATVLLMTTVLVDLNRLVMPDTFNKKYWVDNTKQASRMLVQAMPLMLVLFVLFPRINGPLWSLPKDASTAKSGLSDTMSPGSINQLILSDDIAFRVRFTGELPPQSTRYWRGPVLWYTDGKTWYANNPVEKKTPRLRRTGSNGKKVYQYEVTVEPHDKRWLFALDLPAFAPAGTTMTSDFQLFTNKEISQRQRFNLISYTDYSNKTLSEEDRERALQLSLQYSPRTQQLGQQWRQQGNDAYVVNKALQHFRNEPFVYTLLPEKLGNDPVDQFLFNSREGFCEHYAASFVTLMRAAGIPARVVTGYLGGEMNRFGDYMVIYQADAHAWAEVWLKNQGWVRIDPTAAIAPERVQSRIDNSVLRSGEPVLYTADLSWLRETWQTMSAAWDNVNHNWHEWVIDYDELKQVDLLESLGMEDVNWQKMGSVLMIIFTIMLAVIAAILFLQKPKETDPVQKIYNRFLKKLAHKGIKKQPAEGPADFALRAVKQLPGSTGNIHIISQLYIRLKYSQHVSEKMLMQFKKLVITFSA